MIIVKSGMNNNVSTKYQAFDGKQFKSKSCCEAYEKDLIWKRQENKK